MTDLTDTTRFAFGPVAALSRLLPGVRVQLAHAVVGTTDQYFLDPSLRAAIDGKAVAKVQQRLDALVAELRALGVDASGAIEVGSPYNVVFQLADHFGADLIVVPTRHQHSVVRRISHSVTARAIRAHALPVMTVSQHLGARSGDFGTFRTVLHPVDFGAGQVAATRAAEDFAASTGATLRAVHILRRFDVDSMLDDDEAARAAALAGLEWAQTTAEERLADVVLQIKRVRAASLVLQAETAGEGIVQYAREIGADCIVLPALGRDKVRTQLMGSTAEYVIGHAPCPVLFHDGALDR